jgi:hypothetical protein
MALIEDRQLRFLGHAARLNSNRQPRLLLTAFVQDAPRARGAPVTGLPQALRTTIRKLPDCTEHDWVDFANSREGAEWRAACNRKLTSAQSKLTCSRTNNNTRPCKPTRHTIPNGFLIRTNKTSCAKHLADRIRLFNNRQVSDCIGETIIIDERHTAKQARWVDIKYLLDRKLMDLTPTTTTSPTLIPPRRLPGPSPKRPPKKPQRQLPKSTLQQTPCTAAPQTARGARPPRSPHARTPYASTSLNSEPNGAQPQRRTSARLASKTASAPTTQKDSQLYAPKCQRWTPTPAQPAHRPRNRSPQPSRLLPTNSSRTAATAPAQSSGPTTPAHYTSTKPAASCTAHLTPTILASLSDSAASSAADIAQSSSRTASAAKIAAGISRPAKAGARKLSADSKIAARLPRRQQPMRMCKKN